MALILLFVPQKALGILLFMALSGLPAGQFFMPGWFLAGIGQAVPGVAFSFLLMDRGADRLVRSLNLPGTFGANARQRFISIAIPNLMPAVVAALVATALITLDDIIFVRYLPHQIGR